MGTFLIGDRAMWCSFKQCNTLITNVLHVSETKMSKRVKAPRGQISQGGSKAVV